MAETSMNRSVLCGVRTLQMFVLHALLFVSTVLTGLLTLAFAAAVVYGGLGLWVPARGTPRSAEMLLLPLVGGAALTWLLSSLRRRLAGAANRPESGPPAVTRGEGLVADILIAALIGALWINSCYRSAVVVLDGARAPFPPLAASHAVYLGALLMAAAARISIERRAGRLASLAAALVCACAPLRTYASIETGSSFLAAGALWWLFILLGRVRTDRRRDLAIGCCMFVLALAVAKEASHLHLRWSWEQLRLRLVGSVVPGLWLGALAASGLWALWRRRSQVGAEWLGAAFLFAIGAAFAGVVRERALGDAGAILMVPLAAVAIGLGASWLRGARPVAADVLLGNVTLVVIFGLITAHAREALGRGPRPPEYCARYAAWHQAAWPDGGQESSDSSKRERGHP
jgi:hypothetical protein